MPWFIEKRDDEFCVVKGTREAPGTLVKCHGNEDNAKAHMAALYAAEPDAKGVDEEIQDVADALQLDVDVTDKSIRNDFTVYKEGETWRWRSVSSVAILDKEDEIVSEKAYDDAIAWGRQNGFGELDLVHITGTDVGDCDLSMRIGKVLYEEGPLHNTDRAIKARQAVLEDPDYWGVSIAFLPDLEQFDGTTYTGGIRILKRTILPREMAASHHTAIIAEGGSMAELDEGRVEALKKLGQDEADIAALAEKQKAVEPEEEEALVEKSQDDEPTILDRIKQLLGINEEPPEEQAVEPVAAEKSEEVTPQAGVPLEERLKGFSETIVDQTTKAMQDALAPMVEKIAQIEEKQGRYEQALEMVVTTKEDLVLERLAELPKVVKVAASETEATRTEEDPEPTEKREGYIPEMWDSIRKSVTDALGQVEKGYKV